MALSNWDTWAMNEKGEPINGVYASPGGVVVEFYKNWLYLRDEKAWRKKDASFVKPTIMQIEQGVFRYKDVQITAIRGPKNGIYACVYTNKYLAKKKTFKLHGMVGIGCYGFVSLESRPDIKPDDEKSWGDFAFVGVEQSEIDFLKNALLNRANVEPEHEINVYIYGPGDETRVEKQTVPEYVSNYYNIPEEFQKLDFSKGLRFNQGDMFFASNLGTDVPATDPGNATKLIMNEIVDKMKESE